MDIEYLQKMSPEERKSILEADALTIEETKYTKPLTPDEVSFYKDQLTENSIMQATILDELKEVKNQFKERLKPVSDNISEALQAVKYKAINCEGVLYKLADFDQQMVHTVDVDGNLINSRKMLPQERQFRLQAIKQQSS